MKKRTTLEEKAENAMKKAVSNVVQHAKETGRKIAVWENGRVKKISPK